MNIDLFDFHLPPHLIAQHPSDQRDQSRLLVLNKSTQQVEHRHFFDIIEYLKPGDVLVRNNTKVIPARIYGVKSSTGAHVEVLLLKEVSPDIYECLVGNARVVKIGSTIEFGDGLIKGICIGIKDEGIRVIKFEYQGIFIEQLEKIGEMPLPPYIHEKLSDRQRYQTVYASVAGSSAGPTAGFHFTKPLLDKITALGVTIVDVTLHIGLATFRPVKVNDTSNHKMHFEQYEIDIQAADILNKAKQQGRRIIAIGTTSTRALEANIARYGYFVPTREDTDIFIYPGVKLQAIDGLITNFHLPKSTLIMMISAFAGRELILDTYQEAIAKDYRFFSFGDAMFIYGTTN